MCKAAALGFRAVGMGAVWENTAEKSMDGKKPQDLRVARLPLAYSRPSCRHFL